MSESRQLTVLRSLFRTLHPLLESGLRPARALLTGAHKAASTSDTAADANAAADATGSAPPTRTDANPPKSAPRTQPTLANRTVAMDRTFTDEHLITELDNITRQYETPGSPREPQRSPKRRQYSRDTLMSLLEEAKVRIQVLETELELARGSDEHIPLLTEEWSDDLPSMHARKPD